MSALFGSHHYILSLKNKSRVPAHFSLRKAPLNLPTIFRHFLAPFVISELRKRGMPRGLQGVRPRFRLCAGSISVSLMRGRDATAEVDLLTTKVILSDGFYLTIFLNHVSTLSHYC